MISDKDCWNIIMKFTPKSNRYLSRYKVIGYETEDLVSEWKVQMFQRLKRNCEKPENLKKFADFSWKKTAIDVLRKNGMRIDHKRKRIKLCFSEDVDLLHWLANSNKEIERIDNRDLIFSICKRTTQINALILLLLSEGFTMKETGKMLCRSEGWVSQHVDEVKRIVRGSNKLKG